MKLIFPIAILTAIIVGVLGWIVKSTLKRLVGDKKNISSLEIELTENSRMLKEAQEQIKELEKEIASLKTPQIPQEDYPLENKYWQILEMIQNIDYASHLIDPPLGQSLRQLTSQTLELYGYEFADFSDTAKKHYICEYQPIKDIKVTKKAIIRKGGRTALEGKAFIPENR